ncbi:MAG: ATP-binding protein [Vulcanimicrobiota bacterium]
MESTPSPKGNLRVLEGAGWTDSPSVASFAWGTVLVLVATLLGKSLPEDFGLTNVSMLYLAAVVCSSYFLGKRPALWAAAVAVAGFNFLFVPPTLTFSVAHPQYLGTFLGFFFLGWLVADLTERSNKAAEAAAMERVELARAAAEKELLKAGEKLQKALLNSVSHDLRIPLVSINGTLSSLLNEELTLSPAARREMTENALSEAERLTQLVTNLLQMSRMEAGQMSINAVPCDLWDLVSTTVSGFRRRPGSPEILLEGEEELPLVKVDYVLVQQVLYNLLENAARHGRGVITITLRADPSRVQVSVLDQGEAIAPEEVQRIFDRFYGSQLLSDGGAGLGLSICKSLVEAHGGTIWLEQGKRFCFSLPIASPEKKEAGP